jgi:hypothetical protein
MRESYSWRDVGERFGRSGVRVEAIALPVVLDVGPPGWKESESTLAVGAHRVLDLSRAAAKTHVGTTRSSGTSRVTTRAGFRSRSRPPARKAWARERGGTQGPCSVGRRARDAARAWGAARPGHGDEAQGAGRHRPIGAGACTAAFEPHSCHRVVRVGTAILVMRVRLAACLSHHAGDRPPMPQRHRQSPSTPSQGESE